VTSTARREHDRPVVDGDLAERTGTSFFSCPPLGNEGNIGGAMRKTARGVFAVANLLLAGCSSGSSTLDEFYDQLAPAECRWLGECGWIALSEVDACTTGKSASLHRYGLGGPDYSFESAIAARHLAYDPQGARACLDAWQSADCGDSYGSVPCNVFKPLVPVGGTCRSGECANGLCGLVTERCGASTCRAYLETGAHCVSFFDCDPQVGSCSTLGNSTCVPWVTLGGACLPALADCGSGLACVGYSLGPPNQMGICQVPGTVGAPCQGVCASGHYCDPIAPMRTCKALGAAGAQCAVPTACARGLGCSIPRNASIGTCAAWLDIGDACDPEGQAVCPHDAPCDPATRKCVAAPSLRGAACGPDQNCAYSIAREPARLYCDATTLECTATVPPGGSCVVPPMGAPSWQEPCDYGSCDPITSTCPSACM
jgi:hypothetical protein